MSSRTPIRLTPHRGPLATPPSSAESSPTTSTPPTDISHCSSSATGQTLDVASLQRRISSTSPPTRSRTGTLLDRRRRKGTNRGLLPRGCRLTSLNLSIHSLTDSTHELVQTLTWIVLFCLLIWGFLEWSSYACEPPRRPSSSRSLSRFPLPSPSRALRCHLYPSSCEPSNQQTAILQFLSEQIQHAKAISSLSVGIGSPLRAFVEAHKTTIPSSIVRQSLLERPSRVRESDAWTNLTEFVDSPLVEFTSSSFIGRSFTLALEELSDLISEPTVLRSSATHAEYHLHAIYWRTASNLLLEYSAVRPRVKRLSEHLHALYQQLSPLMEDLRVAGSMEGKSNIQWWNGVVPRPATSINDRIQALVTGLEATLDNVRQLIAYLDWITERLAHRTLRDVLEAQHKTDFTSCLMSLQELFSRSKSLASKKLCFCLDDYGFVPPHQPERVEIVVPGSPTTVHAER